MTSKALVSLALALAFGLSAGPLCAEDNAELEAVRKTVSDMFTMIEPENVSASPVPGWYLIQQGSIIAYISGDGRYLMQGDLIDLDNQINLSELARNDARREVMASVADEETILFSPEEVKYTVSVFTDVDCTYCRRLHSQIDEYLAHGIQIRYLLYPRNGPASRAWNTSEDVWCATDRGNALTMAKLDRDFPTAKCDASMVQDHYARGRDVGLAGTPAIVFEDGTMISGYMTPDQLKAQLEKDAAHP